MGKKPTVSVTNENERISIKNMFGGRQSLALVDTIGKQREQETVSHPECE